ncbi:MAG: tRNA (N(6)-L-threonylcarbamoyladenosine(37)-C(2))-methylthiotransferase MtaB [Alphaproteobacteria bacterium]
MSRTAPLDVITMGCRLNAYESEVMRGHAEAAGLTEAVVVNTCAVTREAVRQARQTIRKAARTRPGVPVIVTGCAAQIDPDSFAAMPEVTRVLGNAEKMRAESFRFTPGDTLRVQVDDIMSVRETAGHLIDGMTDRSRAFVQIQNGCDHRCTFCIIPFGRGPSRSVPAGEVVRQIRHLTDQGTREVVLTGVDITAYGQDLPGTPSLGRLVQQILSLVPDLPRLRLSSLDTVEMDDPLVEAIGGDVRLMPHLHLSLQSGDPMILKRMKRRHTPDQATQICAALRAARPDIAFGADLIAGFPTETEAMFENSLAHIADCGLSYLHVFPFSPREGTPAARMPQLPGPVIRERAARLRAAGEARLRGHLAGLSGEIREVLIETEGRGRTPCYAPVHMDSALAPGTLIHASLDHSGGPRLEGTPVPGTAGPAPAPASCTAPRGGDHG